MKKIASERFGLIMIAAALLAIFTSTAQYYVHDQQQRDQAIKMAGRYNIRLLANLSLAQLLPEQGHNVILDLLNNSLNNPDLAYAVIVDPNNQPLALSTSGKVSIPPATLTKQSNWSTEETLSSDGKSLLEFRAPVFTQGNLAGFVRIAYFQPRLEFDLKSLPLFAQLALPVFLLVPLAYWLIRREFKPLRQASLAIDHVLKKQQLDAESPINSNFQDFMGKFKLFMTMIDQRFDQLSHQNIKAQAATMALSYQRQRIESTLQSLPDAILVMDEAGIATFANSKLMPLLGKPLEQIIGKNPQAWCDHDPVIDLLAKYQNHGNRLQHSDVVEFQPAQNSNKTIAVSAYPLFAPKEIETICGTLVIFHDKTKEVLAELARHDFVNHVAHELKSPLNVIHLYAQSLLDMPGVSGDQQIHAINIIQDEAERLTALISNLLNISKIEAGSIVVNRQRVKLAEFLEDIFNNVRLINNDKHISFNLQLPINLTNINIDKNLLRIAINNLLTNSIKYNKPDGSVCLEAEESGHSIILHVRDTGLGISDADQPHIFDKFYRSDNNQVIEKNGHGLGLALAKEIVELHQGSIILESSLGSGSCFSIELPKTTTII